MTESVKLEPCPFVIGDEVVVRANPDKPWSLDWETAVSDETWFVEAIRLTPKGYDITIAEANEWKAGHHGRGSTDGFEPDDLCLVKRHQPQEREAAGAGMSTESMVTQATLEPCPFCGEQPKSYWQGVSEVGDDGYWAIECCDVHVHRDDEAEAIAAWNKRA